MKNVQKPTKGIIVTIVF